MNSSEQQKIIRRALRRLDESLHQLTKAHQALMDASHQGAPTRESAAWRDLERADELGATNPHWVRERIHTLHALIHARLAASCDNLAGAGTLMARKGEGVYSPWSVARSSLETSAIAFWLLEPELTIEDRLARAFTDRLASIRGAARFGGKVGSPFDFQHRSVEVAELARTLGLPVAGAGLKAHVGERQPSKTALVTALLGDDLSPANYSLFSGWAHGEAWALFDAIQRSQDVADPSDTGRTLRQPALTFDHYQFIAAITARGVSNSVERAIAYFGWARETWTARALSAFRAMGKPLPPLG